MQRRPTRDIDAEKEVQNGIAMDMFQRIAQVRHKTLPLQRASAWSQAFLGFEGAHCGNLQARVDLQENDDREYVSTRDVTSPSCDETLPYPDIYPAPVAQSILISREWSERYNGAATPAVASKGSDYTGTTRPRHTRLLSATRKDTYGANNDLTELAPLTESRAALAAFAIRERREKAFHSTFADRVRYDGGAD